jgi:cytochrome P450
VQKRLFEEVSQLVDLQQVLVVFGAHKISFFFFFFDFFQISKQIFQVASDNAPYLYSVIHEGLRLHPPANVLPLITRVPQQKVDGVMFEKDWIFNVNIEVHQFVFWR